MSVDAAVRRQSARRRHGAYARVTVHAGSGDVAAPARPRAPAPEKKLSTPRKSGGSPCLWVGVTGKHTMKKLAALTLAALLATFAAPARAEQPCSGSTSTCTWSCTQDGQGNIVNYSVSCLNSEWCVGSDGSVDVGLCDSVAPPEDPVDEAFAQVELLDEELGGKTCDLKDPPPKSLYPTK